MEEKGLELEGVLEPAQLPARDQLCPTAMLLSSSLPKVQPQPLVRLPARGQLCPMAT